jgi:oxygen-dependent protoporphyrinogen oxidase
VCADGQLHPGDYDSLGQILGSRLLGLRDKLRLAGLPLEVWRHRSRLDPLHPELAAAIDAEDMASWLARRVGVAARDRLIAPAIRSTFDCEISELSSAFLLLVLRFVLAGFELRSLEGGLGRFTTALAQGLPVRTGCCVECVETEARGARVRYRVGERSGVAVADAVVVATPGDRVSTLVPKLSPAERGFFERVRYVSGAIAHLMLDREPAKLPYYGISFPQHPDLGLYGLAFDHQKRGAAPAGRGLLNAALCEPHAKRLWNASDAEIGAHVVDALARTPIGRLSPRDVVVHRWRSMLPVFEPGSLARLAAFFARSERSPRIAFAGDYLVGPYTEAALVSGMRAAAEIARQLGSRGDPRDADRATG